MPSGAGFPGAQHAMPDTAANVFENHQGPDLALSSKDSSCRGSPRAAVSRASLGFTPPLLTGSCGQDCQLLSYTGHFHIRAEQEGGV